MSYPETMPRGKDIAGLLLPLSLVPTQAYFGHGLHTLGLLRWLLPQTGRADVWVSSFSTSEAFLNGCFILKLKGAIGRSCLLLDQRAARKTLRLGMLMQGVFDHVFLGMNHSKLLLIRNDSVCVSVVTSQNQTYGGRAESTILTTEPQVFSALHAQFDDICLNASNELDIWHGKGIITED